jgi:hypothetical protein
MTAYASRTDHYVWPDGSITPGTLVYRYCDAVAEYELQRKEARACDRLALVREPDGYRAIWGYYGAGVVRSTVGDDVSPPPSCVAPRQISWGGR